MSTLPASNLPPIDQALVPASVRNGDPAAQQAYQAGLAFEQILVQQLAQEMASTASSSDGSGGSTDGTDSTSGLMGSDPANSMYAQLLPTALSSGIMSAGGMGIAGELANALDPTLLSAPAGTTPGQSGSAAGSSATGPATGGVSPSAPSGGAA